MPLSQRKIKHWDAATVTTNSSLSNSNKKKNSIPLTTSLLVICWKIKTFLIGFAWSRNDELDRSKRRYRGGCGRVVNSKAYFTVILGCCIYFIHFVRIGNELYHTEKNAHGTISSVTKTSTSIQNNNNLLRKRITVIQRPSDNAAIQLKILGFKRSTASSPSFHTSPDPVLRSPNPNYGGLRLNFLGEVYSPSSAITNDTIPTTWTRQVHIDEKEAMGGHVYNRRDFEKGWRNFDKYYAFDDDVVRNEAFHDKDNFCRRVSWHRLYNPNCNTIHENEVIPLRKGHNGFLGYVSLFKTTKSTMNMRFAF